MSLFERFETWVIATLRFVLVAVGSLAILATAGLLVWAAWIFISPDNIDHKEFLIAPSYTELREGLLPTSEPVSSPDGTAESPSPGIASQTAKSPYSERLASVTSTLDKQYNIAGREEQKFSERMPASYLEQVLIDQDLAKNFQLEEVADDYLSAFQSLATDIADDEVLSRIADTNARTSIIIEAVNKFHDEYVHRLHKSYDSASSLSVQQSAAQTLTLQLLLWGMGVGFTLFMMVSLVLLVLRIERHLSHRTESHDVSAE